MGTALRGDGHHLGGSKQRGSCAGGRGPAPGAGRGPGRPGRPRDPPRGTGGRETTSPRGRGQGLCSGTQTPTPRPGGACTRAGLTLLPRTDSGARGQALPCTPGSAASALTCVWRRREGSPRNQQAGRARGGTGGRGGRRQHGPRRGAQGPPASPGLCDGGHGAWGPLWGRRSRSWTEPTPLTAAVCAVSPEPSARPRGSVPRSRAPPPAALTPA